MAQEQETAFGEPQVAPVCEETQEAIGNDNDKYFSVKELQTGTELGYREALVELVDGAGEKLICYLPTPTDVVDLVDDVVEAKGASEEEKRKTNKRRMKMAFDIAARSILHPVTHELLFESTAAMTKIVPLPIAMKFFHIATKGIAEVEEEKKDSSPEITSSTDSVPTTE